MTSNTQANADEATVLPARQLQLFPFDQWGAEHAVAVVECPHPGIARAMLGPFVLGDTQQRAEGRVRCIAVAADGASIAASWVEQAHLNTRADLWHEVAAHLDCEKQQPKLAIHATWKPTPNDCFKVWSEQKFWVAAPSQGNSIHRSVHAVSKLLARYALGSQTFLTRWDLARIETQAQAQIVEQISSGTRHLLAALYPGLCEVLTARPRLSISMALQLIALAKQYSPTAVAYALQALRTESFGLLHLATSGQPEQEASEVREAIFSGGSLPEALIDLGIAKAVHRQTVRKPSGGKELLADANLNGCDIPIPGQHWLTAVRLTPHPPLTSKENQTKVNHWVERILDLNIQRNETAEQLLTWCTQVDGGKSRDRLTRLLNQAQAICSAAKGWGSVDLSRDDAIAWALAIDKAPAKATVFGADFSAQIDPDNFYHLALCVAHVSARPLLHIVHPLFNFHPGVPAAFKVPENFTVFALHQMNLATSHGAECENCIHDPNTVVRYVAQGTALYGVRSAAGAVGTIALRCDRTEPSQQVQVQEVSAKKNMTAGFDLCHLAQQLADACNGPQPLEAWMAHEAQCARWRDWASHC